MTDQGDGQSIAGLPPSEAETLAAPPEALDKAVQEAKLLSQDLTETEIRRRAAMRDHERGERFRDHFELIAIGIMWVSSILFVAVGITWFWHLLAPDAYHYLTPDQVAKLQNIVTGGILASIAAGHIRKRLG